MYLPLLLLCAWCAYGHVTAYRELLDDMLGEGVAVDRACLRSSLPALAARYALPVTPQEPRLTLRTLLNYAFSFAQL